LPDEATLRRRLRRVGAGAHGSTVTFGTSILCGHWQKTRRKPTDQGGMGTPRRRGRRIAPAPSSCLWTEIYLH
jgi:hypothetical protein